MPAVILDSDDQEAIARLQYFARGVVDGLMAGHHRSPHKGSSVEFKEHRGYVRGDEIKSIDWKLYGKTDRLFIRQTEDETNLQAWLLLDQSGSMAYRGQKSTNPVNDGMASSKHEYAVRLAACMATMLVAQQDSVGLSTFDTSVRGFIPPRSQRSHLNTLFGTLVQSQPQGDTSTAASLQQLAPRLKRRGLLVLLSDCFDQVDALIKALQFFRFAGHHVLVFQILHRDEIEFPFQHRTEFRSLEQTTSHIVDPAIVRKNYLRKLEEFQQELRSRAAQLGIEWISVVTDQACGEVLGEFVASRPITGASK